MSVYFLDLKYEQVLNCSYFAKDGMGNLDYNMAGYTTGDRVDFMFEIPVWQCLAIKENCSDKRVDVRGDFWSKGTEIVFVEFTVAYKRHVLSPRRNELGTMQPVSISLYLKPVSWGHEDVFKWICMGELPSWINEEEMAEYKGASE